MSRRARLLLDDIDESARRIIAYTIGMDRSAFAEDQKTVDAVLHNLAIIGEASKNLPSEHKDRTLDVDWRRIAGMRDVLVHAYFGVDLDIVWDAVTDKLPPLQAAVRELLDQLGPEA